MDLLTAAGAVLPPTLALLWSSSFGEVRGVHDWLVPGAVWRTAQPHRVLTFDDGPDPERTPRLLDVLAAARVPAVFFVLGQQAERHPALVRRMVAEGHGVGNHSWSHPWMLPMSRARIVEELDRCQKVVADITGVPPRLARPPYGQRDYRYNQLARERGLTPVLWSRNLRDYWGTGPERLVRRLERSLPGDVLLMHDGDPKAPHTVEAVERWLRTRPAVGLF